MAANAEMIVPVFFLLVSVSIVSANNSFWPPKIPKSETKTAEKRLTVAAPKKETPSFPNSRKKCMVNSCKVFKDICGDHGRCEEKDIEGSCQFSCRCHEGYYGVFCEFEDAVTEEVTKKGKRRKGKVLTPKPVVSSAHLKLKKTTTTSTKMTTPTTTVTTTKQQATTTAQTTTTQQTTTAQQPTTTLTTEPPRTTSALSTTEQGTTPIVGSTAEQKIIPKKYSTTILPSVSMETTTVFLDTQTLSKDSQTTDIKIIERLSSPSTLPQEATTQSSQISTDVYGSNTESVPEQTVSTLAPSSVIDTTTSSADRSLDSINSKVLLDIANTRLLLNILKNAAASASGILAQDSTVSNR